jgi:hypothetical protein
MKHKEGPDRPGSFSRRGLLAGAGALAAGSALPPVAAAGEPEAITVSARRIRAFDGRDPTRQRFGALRFRGGLILTSDAADFGGLSGLARPGDGSRLIAVTDRGFWFTAVMAREDGAPSGLEQAALTPMLSASGRPLPRTRSADTEGLCIADGAAFVSVERRHAILRFDWGRRGTAARGQPVALPDAVRDLPNNRGLEALGVAPVGSPVAGALVAIAERSGEHDAPTLGVIAGAGRSGLFRYQLSDGYEVTDLAFLPSGDMFVLERWYRAWRGVGMRLKRVPAAQLTIDALVEGETLMEADLAQEIDNMEGLSIHREGGRTIVTIVSDDNFSRLQRTLLLEFELMA